MVKNKQEEVYYIAICDDDAMMSECIRGIVEAYFDKRQLSVKISMFSNGKELLESEKEYRLIFMDIEMPEMDGLTVVRYLYEKNKRMREREVKVVFLTSHEEVVRKAFQVQAFRFLLKDNYEDEIEECLNAFCDEIAKNNLLEIDCKGGRVYISPKDICYIKSMHNGSEIWLENDMLECRKSLDKWLDVLDENMFFRVHRNCIVNLDKIDYIEEYVYFYNGDRIEYSVRNEKKLQKRYRQYILDNVRWYKEWNM